MTLYKNKYRNESARAQWWDYGRAAAYFVTICTQDRIHYFGEINNGKMILNPVGAIADVLWHEIKNHAKDVELDAFVVMPNHIHGILVLKNDFPSAVGANRFQNPGKNTLSSIIGSYKSAVTRHVRRLGYSFDWQSRFHDHIIRDEASYQRIAQYIENNPKKWKEDSLKS